jgi:hypothetical protein
MLIGKTLQQSEQKRLPSKDGYQQVLRLDVSVADTSATMNIRQ